MFSNLNFVTNAMKNPLSRIKESIIQMSKQRLQKQKVQIIQIVPGKIYHISYPTDSNVDSLKEHLKAASEYQIWNISEYSYSEQIIVKLLGQGARNSDGRQVIYNLTYEYFANIPFCQMIKAIQSIEAFLVINRQNKVFIHCQQNKRRSAILLSSYIFLTGLQTDIVQSILKVNKLLRLSMQDKQLNSPGSIYKSQHLVLKNLMNYINNNTFINKNTWYLKKILINNAPKIQSVIKSQQDTKNNENIKFKILLEIRSVQGIIYKKIFNDQFIQGQSLCLRIPSTENVLLKDDFLVIIKYVYGKKGYSILRSQLNTNFIYDQYLRVQRNDMDLSVNNAHSKNQTIFMDLLMDQNLHETSELSYLNIVKDSSEKETTNSSLDDQKQTQHQSIKNFQESSKKSQDQQQDDFKILDQEQQAAHNQKMQKQIQEELVRELENLRKKKTKDEKKEDYKPKTLKNQEPKITKKQETQPNISQDEESQPKESQKEDSKISEQEEITSKNNQKDEQKSNNGPQQENITFGEQKDLNKKEISELSISYQTKQLETQIKDSNQEQKSQLMVGQIPQNLQNKEDGLQEKAQCRQNIMKQSLDSIHIQQESILTASTEDKSKKAQDKNKTQAIEQIFQKQQQEIEKQPKIQQKQTEQGKANDQQSDQQQSEGDDSSSESKQDQQDQDDLDDYLSKLEKQAEKQQ